MHGRKKSDLPQTKEEKDAVQSKISNYKKVVGAIRHKRASGEMDGEYKKLLGKLLRLHPDYYSMWNFRKEVVLQEVGRIEEAGEEGGRSEALLCMYEEELALSVDCIQRNPKSYPAWHHHKWALQRGLEFLGGRSALEKELALCAQFLELDGRNFHCWAHRMWVAEQMSLSAQEDLDFTTAKIKQNFSNYSAFHFRSKVLPRMVDEAGSDRWQLLSDELDLAHDAMFTEPADQSVWWYHHFLLTWAEEGTAAGGGDDAERCAERYAEILRAEASMLEELIEVEGRCKWAELALLLVMRRLERALQEPTVQPAESPSEGVAGDGVDSVVAVEVADAVEVDADVEVPEVDADVEVPEVDADVKVTEVGGDVVEVGGDVVVVGDVKGVEGGVGVVGSGGSAGGVDAACEAVRLREACAVMTSRLSELDPMHGRFYAFVGRGGSVWGSRRGGALGVAGGGAADVGRGEGPDLRAEG